jgi:hypothetical protein
MVQIGMWPLPVYITWERDSTFISTTSSRSRSAHRENGASGFARQLLLPGRSSEFERGAAVSFSLPELSHLGRPDCHRGLGGSNLTGTDPKMSSGSYSRGDKYELPDSMSSGNLAS